jgi:peptide deformylase
MMTIRTILRYPDPRLHQRAVPVTVVDDDIRSLIDDMAETMYAAPGIGLAATQIDVHRRIIVIDLSETRDQLQVFINPEILRHSEDLGAYEEGCLSVPGVFEEVERPARVEVRALDRQGQAFTLKAEGLLAVCLQHEIDHLDGKVFVQHLSRLKQGRIRARLQKQDRAVA